MKLEELLSIAYDATHRFGGGHINMYTQRSTNQPQFIQEFKKDVRPFNNRIPKKNADGSTTVSSPIGFKELVVWVRFGDAEQWTGPELRWLYSDRSFRWDGETKEGDINNLDELRSVSNMLEEEAKRIFKIEMDYSGEHGGSLDGLVVDGYAVI